ncbi:hypothetical protein KSF78_0004967 [Schistosoma japonicum]|nr:hypothetical protein KSF78_0004967 [Schistosoma japonicum]
MASRIFTVNFSLIILWILSMIAVEPITYMQPVKFDNEGSKYLYLDNVNVTMTLDYLLTFFDDDCRKNFVIVGVHQYLVNGGRKRISLKSFESICNCSEHIRINRSI